MRHYSTHNEQHLVGKTARCCIDAERRNAHVRCHTAGHLLSIAVETLYPSYKAVKGHHYPDGAYVEFAASSPVVDLAKINAELARLIAEDLPTDAFVVSPEELSKLCPEVSYSRNSALPIRKYFSALLLLSAQSLFGISLATMQEEEQKACGLEKLTPEERLALDGWLVKQTPPPPAPITKSSKIKHGEFTVTANINLGRFITLNNGITYDIPSRARKKTMSWKVGDKVQLVEPIRPITFKIEHVAQKATIGAKITTKAPKVQEQKPE